MVRKSKDEIETILTCNCDQTLKLNLQQNTNCDKTQMQQYIKKKNSISHKTEELKLVYNSKSQIASKLKNSSCEKNLKLQI